MDPKPEQLPVEPDVEVDNDLPHEVRREDRQERREERQEEVPPPDAAPIETSRSDAVEAPPANSGLESDVDS